MTDPIFVVGTGRCGSTTLHRMLARHPRLAWLTQVCERCPHRPTLNNLALALLDVPMLRRVAQRRLYPVEAYPLWERVCPGFSEPCRDLLAGDVMPEARDAIRRLLGRLSSPRRPRLLLKITGWPRIGLLKEVFPDARFIHVYRDGRAVANSLIRVPWWRGWQGPGGWRWGELSEDQRTRWEHSGRSFVVLAGLEWEILMQAMEQAKASMSRADLLEIRYEDLCADYLRVMRDVTDFAGLVWSRTFEKALRSFELTDRNYKWREELTREQQKALNEFLSDSLARHGYQ